MAYSRPVKRLATSSTPDASISNLTADVSTISNKVQNLSVFSTNTVRVAGLGNLCRTT
jgi:hypothetical protein